MRTILLIGDDEFLLQSRAAVLRRLKAKTVTTRAENLESFVSDSYDLVVLCHTIEREHRSSVRNRVRRLWPRTRVLQVVEYAPHVSDALDYGDGIVASLDPGSLIATASRLLAGPAVLKR